MEILNSIKELSEFLTVSRNLQKPINFVPTMGSLHNGHLSLIQIANQHEGVSLASIFVNKAQFNDSNDYDKYPRDLKNDLDLLLSVNCDAVFCPSADEMNQLPSYLSLDLSGFDVHMEGAHRPGHFNGVATILFKFFNLIKPDKAIFGIKDYQQCLLVEHIINHFNFNIEIVLAPIIREASGLAMSSRNKLISPEKIETSVALYKSLLLVQEKFGLSCDPEELLNSIQDQFRHVDFEYLYFVEDGDMIPLKKIDSNKKIRACICGSVSNIRLIDNMLLN